MEYVDINKNGRSCVHLFCQIFVNLFYVCITGDKKGRNSGHNSVWEIVKRIAESGEALYGKLTKLHALHFF